MRREEEESGEEESKGEKRDKALVEETVCRAWNSLAGKKLHLMV